MTLTELEVEQYKADGPGTPTPKEWNALCDLALAQIRAQGQGMVPVPESALKWLFGEEGEFECPPDKYFRGKPAPYWWRSVFRSMLAAALKERP